jgi:undecaprenyl-phosphate 4-deoxy-4-formamido-L-arabinose transferase
MPELGGTGMSLTPGVSIVVPVFNGARTLGELTDRLEAVLTPLGAFEVILVDDGSPDGSWAEINALALSHPFIRGFRLSRNYGQHNALLAGIRLARYDVVVTVDDDLQHPPEEIPRLLEELDRGADVVYGTPIALQHGLWRGVASRVTKLALQNAMGSETARSVSAFRAFRTWLRDACDGYHGPFVSVDVLLTWGTTRFAAVPVRHDPRKEGTSNYTFRSLLSHAMNMMTGYSTRPLQVASLIGFSFAVFGLVVLAYVVGRTWINGGSVPGFPFIASIVAIFSGAQLFALGIIGEYLARMHFRLMQKPTYVVAQSSSERLHQS